MVVLGIESSCDETSVAVVENGKKVLSNVVSSSLHLHRKYGGIVPEIACRHHTEIINIVLERALKKARRSLNEIDLISVTKGPGLVGALLIGISLAKALSYSLKIPLVGVNHLQAHLYSAIMATEEMVMPAIGLLVSGGHCCLVYLEDIDKITLLGQTRDDAVGEAYDKAAKILALGFPGGPVIDDMARRGDGQKIRFPYSVLKNGDFDFSFSGVKTALLYYVEGLKRKKKHIPVADICAGFQEAVIGMLLKKTEAACYKKNIKGIIAGGGVSANRLLRERLTDMGHRCGVRVFFPSKDMCTDNAGMVAGLGFLLYNKGIVSDYGMSAEPSLSF